MGLLEKLLGCVRHSKQTKPHRPAQEAALLQIPVELILEIAAQLPRQSLYTLAQSCYALRTILGNHFHLYECELSLPRTQSLDFFSCLSKDFLDRFVCDKCIDFHVAEYKDFPRGRWREYQLNTMMPGCKRQKLCRLTCCHPPHLCSCHRRVPMPYVQKQHIELVLEFRDPSWPLDEFRLGIDGTMIPEQRFDPHRACRLFRHPVPCHLSTTYHYKIMTRVVQGRFLLYREIHWMNGGRKGIDGLKLMHFVFCPAVRAQDLQLPWDELFRPKRITTSSDYGKVTKCPYCMSEYILAALTGRGTLRVWQDLGSETDPRHACYMDMVVDRDKAEREAGDIVKLFGPV